MSEPEKDRLVRAIGAALGGCREEIQQRQLAHFYKADEDYGRRVSEALGLSPEKAELAVNDDVPDGQAVRN